MNGKKHPIEILEKALKYEKDQLDNNRNHIRSLGKEIAVAQQYMAETETRIAWLKDAIYKLKGLDNLEKKNIEEKRPASMENNLLRTETAMLYGRSIASYSLRELAAYIIHQSDKITKILKRR